MSSSLRSKNEGTATAVEQIQDFAFTIRGHALKDGMRDRDLYDEINGRHPTSIAYRDVIESDDGSQPLFREQRTDGIYFGEELLIDSENNLQRYMVVGYALRTISDELKKQYPSTRKQEPVGTIQSKEWYNWVSAKMPVLVVTPILT